MKLNGKLVLGDNLDIVDYGMVIKSEHDVKYISLTEKLNNLNGHKVRVIVRIKNDYEFNAEGVLLGVKAISKIQYWMVGNKNLDNVLWNLTGENIEITIKDLEVTKDEFGKPIK